MQIYTEKEWRTGNYDEEEEEAAAGGLNEDDEEYVYREEDSDAMIAEQPAERGRSARAVVKGEEAEERDYWWRIRKVA